MHLSSCHRKNHFESRERAKHCLLYLSVLAAAPKVSRDRRSQTGNEECVELQNSSSVTSLITTTETVDVVNSAILLPLPPDILAFHSPQFEPVLDITSSVADLPPLLEGPTSRVSIKVTHRHCVCRRTHPGTREPQELPLAHRPRHQRSCRTASLVPTRCWSQVEDELSHHLFHLNSFATHFDAVG